MLFERGVLSDVGLVKGSLVVIIVHVNNTSATRAFGVAVGADYACILEGDGTCGTSITWGGCAVAVHGGGHAGERRAAQGHEAGKRVVEGVHAVVCVARICKDVVEKLAMLVMVVLRLLLWKPVAAALLLQRPG
jgi:hypothetical protein